MPKTLILSKTYGWIYIYQTLRRAKKEKTCQRCKRTIKKGELYLEEKYGRAYLELMGSIAFCFDCLIKLNPDLEKVIDKKGNVVWERG
jgi:hypothetical protein